MVGESELWERREVEIEGRSAFLISYRIGGSYLVQVEDRHSGELIARAMGETLFETQNRSAQHGGKPPRLRFPQCSISSQRMIMTSIIDLFISMPTPDDYRIPEMTAGWNYETFFSAAAPIGRLPGLVTQQAKTAHSSVISRHF
jgi:hypothetical protein